MARTYGVVEVQLSKKELKPDFTVTTMIVKSQVCDDVIIFTGLCFSSDDVKGILHMRFLSVYFIFLFFLPM